MLLLHISDIHFRTPDCRNPDMDPDRAYRTLLLRDARARIAKIGPLGAIVVTGDIAYKGDPEEYCAASDWLSELAQACGCALERIFVVPGNHDVDRHVVSGSPSVRNAQQAIFNAPEQQREREFRTQFTDRETGPVLLAPLAAYNDFAKLYNCQVYSPDRLSWKQDLPLTDGIRLRLHGLTSTMLSGFGDRDTKPGSLYLSPLQTALDPVDDVVNVVLSHHPPDWFLDADDVDDVLSNRAAIQLLGHKHRQRVTLNNGYARFSAGAVNPDRNEPGWQPGYNLIEVRATGTGANRMLEVDAHVLLLQASPEQFVPRRASDGVDIFRHRLPIPETTNPSGHSIAADVVAVEARSHAIADATADANVEASMSDEQTRNLIYRFWSLTGSQRREIALGLGLITEEDLRRPEPERYGRALLNAHERGLLDQVAVEVAKREKK
ncbi:MAG: hypothetical protein E6R14_00665 [Thermomicrobiales bacterium]|nr:MAG: hypothetical protein E6R14_00665 [Thermomicrobiales bacterium]